MSSKTYFFLMLGANILMFIALGTVIVQQIKKHRNHDDRGDE